MQAQLRVIQAEQSKGKSSERTSTAADERQYLLNFNSSISQCMAKTMEHLSEFVFISVANMTGQKGCILRSRQGRDQA